MKSVDVKTFLSAGISDTEMIQKGIDECSRNSQQLIISAGTYNIGTLFLRDNSAIKLEKGALLNGIPNVEAYSNAATFVDGVGRARGKALIVISEVKNVSITGDGTVCGNGAELEGEDRPFLVRTYRAENVLLEGIALKSSPSWCLHIDESKNIRVRGVTIHNRVCGNNDGIDIDSSENVEIDGCDISSGDDAICIKTTSNKPCRNIHARNCRITTDWGGFKMGTESVGDMTDITIEDCLFYDCMGGSIKIVPVDGSNVSDIKIRNIKMQNCTGPIFIANGERNREYAGEKRDTLSTIKNVEISNIEGDVISAPIHGMWDNEVWGNALGGIILSGTPQNHLKNIKIDNVKLEMPGGYTGAIPETVREMGTRYPEFHRFDPVPAKGIYIRHAEDINICNIEMTYKKEDVREEIFLEDATDCCIE